MVYSARWGSRWSTILFKYLSQSVRTLRLLFATRPRVVFVMTPPVIACVPVWLYAALTRAAYVIDAHTGAFVDERWRPLLFLHRFFSRRALTTIVTNGHLADIVRGWSADVTIVSDVPIHFAEPASMAVNGRFTMTLVNTFTKDEPIEAFLRAAGRLPDVHFFVTGRLEDADPALLRAKPLNVTFTGFLSDSEYAGRLLASDAVICLTTADHTMQRGAYEAIYLGKPVVTSRFAILRQAFPRGAVHVDGTPEDIGRGISEMRHHLDRYREEAKQLREEKLSQWKRIEEQLRGRLWR